MKKYNLNWRSVVLGVVLCAVLAVFIASKAADAQVVPARTEQARVLQRAANVSDVYDKTITMEAKIDVLNERLIRLEQKIDAMNKDMEVVLRVLKRLDPQNQR